MSQPPPRAASARLSRVAVAGLVVGVALVAAAVAGASSLAPWAASALGLLRDTCSLLVVLHRMDPFGSVMLFVLVFTALSALAVPGCSLLALAAGAVFGPWWGALLVTLSSSAGATLSFLAARRWLRGPVRRRWSAAFDRVEPVVARDGALGLFLLRVAPVVPFPALNPLMGLTSMPAWTFFWVSAVGMAAGSAAYAMAGAGFGAALDGRAVGTHAAMAAGLAALVLLPWGWRRWQQARAGE
jgi:uncharacterized membrane protein YdjX (TVP38/TMEM64 family)